MLVLKGLCRILIIVVALSLACHTAEAKGHIPGVSVEGVERVTHLSTSGMNLWLDVRNERCSRVVLKRGEIVVKVDGVERVAVMLRDKVVVRGRSMESVLVPLRFRSRSSFALGALLRRVLEGDAEDISLSLTFRGGTALFRRTVEVEDIPLCDAVEMFALPEDLLLDIKEYLGSL